MIINQQYGYQFIYPFVICSICCFSPQFFILQQKFPNQSCKFKSGSRNLTVKAISVMKSPKAEQETKDRKERQRRMKERHERNRAQSKNKPDENPIAPPEPPQSGPKTSTGWGEREIFVRKKSRTLRKSAGSAGSGPHEPFRAGTRSMGASIGTAV
ncbi:MAG: hypothetical protein IJ523_03995 [Succinivibrionaceae bacterium]|nr:hypothetical protein [Succinivibrionaceae bacterium]